MLHDMVTTGRVSRPPRMVIYGGEGVGKSTFAATIPGALFLPTEGGLDNIDCASLPVAETLGQVIAGLDALASEKHAYSCVIIDTVTSLERLIYGDLCRSHRAPSIEVVGGGFGRGYNMAAEKFREVLARLDLLRTVQQMAIVIIAHGRTESFADPDGPAYDRWTPRLHKAIGSQLVEWADIVGFACRRQRTTEAGTRTIARPVGADGGDRILRTQGGPSCVAKSRYEKIPAEVPLVWGEVSKYL